MSTQLPEHHFGFVVVEEIRWMGIFNICHTLVDDRRVGIFNICRTLADDRWVGMFNVCHTLADDRWVGIFNIYHTLADDQWVGFSCELAVALSLQILHRKFCS